MSGSFKMRGGVGAYNKAITCRRSHQSYKGDILDKKRDNRVTKILMNRIQNHRFFFNQTYLCNYVTITIFAHIAFYQI